MADSSVWARMKKRPLESYHKTWLGFIAVAVVAVVIAGIPVGDVTSMKLDGDHVEAGLKIRDNIVLGKDSRATIKVTTILGSRYLALEPNGSASLPHNTFDLSHTDVPYDLQSALRDATTTFEQVDSDRFSRSRSRCWASSSRGCPR